MLDGDGRAISQSGWRIYYADSEEQAAEDGSADNLIDGDPDTIWHSVWSLPHPPHPHTVVVDLGHERVVGGFQYLARRANKSARIKGYRFYVSVRPFGAR